MLFIDSSNMPRDDSCFYQVHSTGHSVLPVVEIQSVSLIISVLSNYMHVPARGNRKSLLRMRDLEN